MGFFLKKLLATLLMPMSIGMLLLIIGLWLLFRQKIKAARIVLSAGVVWLALFSYSPVTYALLAPLEHAYPKLEKVPEGVTHLLILGGGMEERGWELLRLYHSMEEGIVVTSGYEGNRKVADAVRTADTFKKLGIPAKKILVHDDPRDTKEEAVMMKELLGEEPFVLVTSASHMPRAMALFKKEGLNPIAAPADLKTENEFRVFSFVGVENLQNSTLAVHEYIGLAWAWLRGQI
jgi:uncharacterized SAM-binding protein YcdF (DUF218 family)